MDTPESTQPTVLTTVQHCPTCQQHFSGDARFCPFDGDPLVAATGYRAESDPLIGSVVDGRYEVESVLGEGGMGTVYCVRHRALDKRFALKVMRADLARQGDLAARFIQEARAAASIGHPNIVQITDFGQLPTSAPYFVMEMLDGMSLAKMIRACGPLPAGLAVRILQQVGSALAAAHAVGVIHRDLKPDNVHIARGNVVKILDFGVAKMAGAGRLTRTGMVFGTPHYMSPEQASGGEVDHRADIYALGIIMYEMFTGRVPFEADSYMGVLTKHMYMAPELPSRAHEGARELGALEDVTMKCLEKRPEARYPSMDALVREVESIVRFNGDELEITRASTAPERARARSRAPQEVERPEHVELRGAVPARPLYGRALGVGLGLAGLGLAAVVYDAQRTPQGDVAPTVVMVGASSAAPLLVAPPAAAAELDLRRAAPPATSAEPTPASSAGAASVVPPASTSGRSALPRAQTQTPTQGNEARVRSPARLSVTPPASSSTHNSLRVNDIVNPWAK